MKRLTIFIALVAGALALAAAGLADPGKKPKTGHAKFTFTMTTTDNGPCGNTWANDTETRTDSVKDNGDGTITRRRAETGAYTHLAAETRGACATTAEPCARDVE